VTTFLSGPVTVTVPATSANLGPGFDALGLALELRDRVTAQVVEQAVEQGGVQITVSGHGSGEVPLDDRHLVHRSMRAAFDRMGTTVPGVRLHCENAVPHARGLGSSSAAILSGVCLARGLVAGGSLLMDDDAVFTLAAELEGHPDNVAPAFYGGFTVAYRDADRFHAATVAVDPRVQIVVFVPPEGVETSVARGLLPAKVSHRDAAANAGRAALLVAALSREPELLLAATEDRLHQEYREPAMPASVALVRALRADGIPAVVSGAGPSVLAFTDATDQPGVADRAPQGWQAMMLPIDRDGVRVTLPEEAGRPD
jgi:homoserine kinase